MNQKKFNCSLEPKKKQMTYAVYVDGKQHSRNRRSGEIIRSRLHREDKAFQSEYLIYLIKKLLK